MDILKIKPQRADIRPPDHDGGCHLVLFNGNGKCTCGDDERYERDLKGLKPKAKIALYKVGGCVRDQILGLEPNDIDYVVTGVTPSQMESNGYKQVGKDFPVYLHPTTGEEYALARTERKSGLKHTDFETVFDTSVTIADDLIRRDLTINSIAMDLATGDFIDPYNGVQDIQDKVLRHTSEAFKEDPLRVLRLARFSARFPDFTIAPETMTMVQKMVRDGELNHLSSDRIWQETKKALMSPNPMNYIQSLHDFGALDYLMFDSDSKYKSPLWDEPKSDLERVFASTADLDDENKLLVRATTVFFTLFAFKYSKPQDFIDLLTKRHIPSDIVNFIQYLENHIDILIGSIVTITSVDKMIADFDKMSLKSKLQKNPRFFENLELYFANTDGKFSERNVKTFMDMKLFMLLYLDTQDHLSSWAKLHFLNEGEMPTGEQYAAQLKRIRHDNLLTLQCRMECATSQAARDFFAMTCARIVPYKR